MAPPQIWSFHLVYIHAGLFPITQFILYGLSEHLLSGHLSLSQVVALSQMGLMENASTEFGAMRGGMCGDEPGLGKTVTSLALIASTAGLRPASPAGTVSVY
jgi:hypothetical protein